MLIATQEVNEKHEKRAAEDREGLAQAQAQLRHLEAQLYLSPHSYSDFDTHTTPVSVPTLDPLRKQTSIAASRSLSAELEESGEQQQSEERVRHAEERLRKAEEALRLSEQKCSDLEKVYT